MKDVDLSAYLGELLVAYDTEATALDTTLANLPVDEDTERVIGNPDQRVKAIARHEARLAELAEIINRVYNELNTD